MQLLFFFVYIDAIELQMFNLKSGKSLINILLLHIGPVIAYQSYYCYKLLRKKGRGLRPCGCYKDQSVNYKRRDVLNELRLEVLGFITNMWIISFNICCGKYQ